MNSGVYDILAIALMVFFVIRAMKVGLLRTLVEILGAVIALAALRSYGGSISAYIASALQYRQRWLGNLIGYSIIFLIAYWVFPRLGKKIVIARGTYKPSKTGRFFGAVTGFGKALIVIPVVIHITANLAVRMGASPGRAHIAGKILDMGWALINLFPMTLLTKSLGNSPIRLWHILLVAAWVVNSKLSKHHRVREFQAHAGHQAGRTADDNVDIRIHGVRGSNGVGARTNPSKKVKPIPSMPDPEKMGEVACFFCQAPIIAGPGEKQGKIIICPDPKCQTPVHEECWEYHKGCPMPYCPYGPHA